MDYIKKGSLVQFFGQTGIFQVPDFLGDFFFSMDVGTLNLQHQALNCFCGSFIVIVLGVLVEEWSSLLYFSRHKFPQVLYRDI